MGKKVLIVSTKYPFPTDDGKKAVLAGFLAYLVDRFGREGVQYAVMSRKREPPRSDVACETVWIDPPGRLVQAWNAFKCLVGLDDRSMQEALTYSPRIERQLRAMVASARPEVLLLDTVRAGQYFWSPEPGGPRRILYMDDLFSLRFRRMSEIAADGGVRFDPAGTFHSSLPGLAQRLLKLSFIQNVLYRIEAAKVGRRERESPGRFDRCLLLNDNEVHLLKELCPTDSIFAVRPMLFREPRCAARRFDGDPLFLLFGSLRHPVYRASVVRFLERGMGAVVRMMPEARVCIVGDGADDEMRRHCERFGRSVELLGFVDRIEPLFASACALVVPLLAAGGLKLKTLTALYYGLPIIATEAGTDGMPLRDGVHYIKENALERFAVHMKRLCELPFNREMSRNAARLFEEHYSKERVYEEYDLVLGGKHDPEARGVHAVRAD